MFYWCFAQDIYVEYIVSNLFSCEKKIFTFLKLPTSKSAHIWNTLKIKILTLLIWGYIERCEVDNFKNFFTKGFFYIKSYFFFVKKWEKKNYLGPNLWFLKFFTFCQFYVTKWPKLTIRDPQIIFSHNFCSIDALLKIFMWNI